MKILNLFIAAITLLCVSAVTLPAEADPLSNADYELGEEFNTYPDHFFSGCGVGTGVIKTYKKSTLNVEMHNPPYYLISVDAVFLSYQNDTRTWAAYGYERERFYYDWDSKKAYTEYPIPDTNEKEWQEITSTFRNEKGIANDIFKLAYNMDFFSDPYDDTI